MQDALALSTLDQMRADHFDTVTRRPWAPIVGTWKLNRRNGVRSGAQEVARFRPMRRKRHEHEHTERHRDVMDEFPHMWRPSSHSPSRRACRFSEQLAHVLPWIAQRSRRKPAVIARHGACATRPTSIDHTLIPPGSHPATSAGNRRGAALPHAPAARRDHRVRADGVSWSASSG